MRRKHYVYRLTKHEPHEGRKYYVGKHSGELCDLNKMKYKTSSKLVRKIFDAAEWDIKIVKVFDTPEEAIKYEAKYHWRVDVSRHTLFFNESNQSSDGGFDRTKKVTVINTETGERMTIDTHEFHNNRDIYESINKDLVAAKDKNTGKTILIVKEEFDNNENLVGVNKGVIHVIEKDTDKRITISCEEYHKNKEKYKHSLQNISVYDTVLLKKTTIPRNEFDGIRYIGIKAFTKESKKECPVCKRDISASNYLRHIETHNNNYLWITDNNNTNTYKCLEVDYLTNEKMKNDWYVVEGETHKRIGYINSEAKNMKYVGRVNGTIPEEIMCKYR